MSYSVYIRPLMVTDAKISYKWRNNKIVWEFTEFKPTRIITMYGETQWLKKALSIKNDHRFAICVKETDRYIGNVQLINVDNWTGNFHIFIGDVNYWGKGIGKEATELMLYYGFNILGLNDISLGVYQQNIAAYQLYKKMGFQVIDNSEALIHMVITKNNYNTLLNVNEIAVMGENIAFLTNI